MASEYQKPGIGRHAWGVFRPLPDPTFRGRGGARLISTHKTSFAAQASARSHRSEYVRRLTKAERGR